jgi:hypothetical protein
MRGIPRPAIFGRSNSNFTRISRRALWSALHDQGSSGPSASGVVAFDCTAFAHRADRWAASAQTPIQPAGPDDPDRPLKGGTNAM